MRYLKQAGILVGLAAAGWLVFVLFLNDSLTLRSRQTEDPESRIDLLLRAKRVYPFNDRTDYELGKAYYDLGLRNLGRGRDEDSSLFQLAVRTLRRSIALNPFSPFAHFHLAQSFFYAAATSSVAEGDAWDEYRKSALLAGQNSQIFFEVGKIFLSRWKSLSEKEKNFSLDILRQLLIDRDSERMMTLLTIWDMTVQDYEVMDKILPDDPYALKFYAKFLGEKSRSAEMRQRALSRVDFLQFGRAKTEFEAGERALFSYRIEESSAHFRACLNFLGEIKFFQDLAGRPLIDPDEYQNLKKSAALNLIKTHVEAGASLHEVKADLESYLELEDQPAAMGDMESYLRGKGLMFANPENHLDDLEALEYQLRMYFKQSRYIEIIRIGRILGQSVVFVPPEKKEPYIQVLGIIGDALQKIDSLYDAGDFYQKALDLDPGNLETLLRVRRNFARLNEDQKVREIQEHIDTVVSPANVSFGLATVTKGMDFVQFLLFQGVDRTLDLVFDEARDDPLPLITVIFNGRAVWDGYVRGRVHTLTLKTRVGRNQLNVIAVNRQVNLLGLEIR